MKLIPVQHVGDIEGHDTPEAAIEAAKNHRSPAKTRADGAALAGSRFVDAWRGADQWVLEFSGGLWLRVFADPTAPVDPRVGWAVERERPAVTADPEPVVFEWPWGRKAQPDPAALAAGRRGAEFWQLWVDELGF